MTGFVVDASICTKWMLAEEFSEVAAQLLMDDVELHAPSLVWLEVGSALREAVLRGNLDAVAAVAMFATLDVYQVAIHTEGDLAVRALEIALASG